MAFRQHYVGQYSYSPEKFKAQLVPGDVHFFTNSIPRDWGFERWLEKVGLAGKVIYRSSPFYVRAHSERNVPSVYIVICRSESCPILVHSST